jgi:hypothetical protein
MNGGKTLRLQLKSKDEYYSITNGKNGIISYEGNKFPLV